MSPRGTTAGFRRAQTCAELRGLYERIEAVSQLIRKQVQAPSNTHAARCLSPGLMANTFGKRGSRILLAMSSTLDALGFLATASRLHDARRIALHIQRKIMSGRAHLLLGMSYASNDAILLSICLLPRLRVSVALPMRPGFPIPKPGGSRFMHASLSRLIATF